MLSTYVRVAYVNGTTGIERRDGLRHYGFVSQVLDEDPVLTLEEMHEIMDSDAEGDNYHNFVGLPDMLAEYVREAGGSDEVVYAFVKRLFDGGGFRGIC